MIFTPSHRLSYNKYLGSQPCLVALRGALGCLYWALGCTSRSSWLPLLSAWLHFNQTQLPSLWWRSTRFLEITCGLGEIKIPVTKKKKKRSNAFQLCESTKIKIPIYPYSHVCLNKRYTLYTPSCNKQSWKSLLHKLKVKHVSCIYNEPYKMCGYSVSCIWSDIINLLVVWWFRCI